MRKSKSDAFFSFFLPCKEEERISEDEYKNMKFDNEFKCFGCYEEVIKYDKNFQICYVKNIKRKFNFYLYERCVDWRSNNINVPRNRINIYIDLVHLKALLQRNCKIFGNKEIQILDVNKISGVSDKILQAVKSITLQKDFEFDFSSKDFLENYETNFLKKEHIHLDEMTKKYTFRCSF